MSDHREEQPTTDDDSNSATGSVANPFATATDDEVVEEMRGLAISRRRAAMLGLISGLFMVGLLLICFVLVVLLERLTT